MKMKSTMPHPSSQQRRNFLKLSGLLGLGAASAALLPTPHAEALLFGPKEYKVSETRLSMGSFLAITAFHPSRDEAQHAIGLAWEEIDRLCKLLSRHDPSTPLSQLNRTGTLPEGQMEVVEVVARSLYHHKQTGGAFDITVQPVLDLYEKRFAAGRRPTDAEITALLPRVGSEHIRFAKGGVSFAREGMRITLDALAPGYIVDRASELLTRNGVVNHLINCSGDIRTSGAAAKGTPWTVAIQDPAKKKAYPEVVSMGTGAICTSGDYEAFYDKEKIFHHIVNGRTGHSPAYSTSVTVKGPLSVMDADAMSTALFVMSPAEGLAFVNRQPDLECFLIDHQGDFKKSANWSKLA